MGDGVGNLEEQIRCVGEQIRRVEEQIDRCPDDEERKLLLGKEAQLRVEKAQLREQILQGRDLGTEYEWLVQKVVAPAPYSGARIYPSSSNQNRMWIPVKVEHWDVRGNIEEFLSSADKKKRERAILFAVAKFLASRRLVEKRSKVGYGVLTDVGNWYLFNRDNAGCLKISAGLKVSVSEAAPPEPFDESTDDYIGDPNYRARGNDNSGSETRRSGRTRPGEEQPALQDVPAEDLNLKKAGGIISCEGWSGYVVIGRLHGQPVALKFAYLGTERAEALLKEVVAYTKELWGVFVPRLIGYGTTNKGQVVFVAIELIEGVELGKVVATKEVTTAALEALDAVHACGLLHGDVSPTPCSRPGFWILVYYQQQEVTEGRARALRTPLDTDGEVAMKGQMLLHVFFFCPGEKLHKKVIQYTIFYVALFVLMAQKPGCYLQGMPLLIHLNSSSTG
uniref:Predicted protein n=1 Tax=Physcomitrium patens TaxID=3218 RepID=A9U5R5_PHYPA